MKRKKLTLVFLPLMVLLAVLLACSPANDMGEASLPQGYLGQLSDSDILATLEKVWSSLPEIVNDDMKEIGGDVLDSGYITGFNIRNTAYSVAFDAERSLLYSHSSHQHIHELITLLASLDINARVALEPKTSWYYWDGLNYDREYDIHFEFETIADKIRFDGIIKEHAQRREGAENLLTDSWWAPLYASDIAVNAQYVQIVNNTFFFEDTDYFIVSYGLNNATSNDVIQEFEARGATAVQSPIYVNIAFYDYLIANLIDMGEAE